MVKCQDLTPFVAHRNNTKSPNIDTITDQFFSFIMKGILLEA